MDRQDEISVVMLFNKLQEIGDIEEIQKIPPAKLKQILADTPPYLLNLMAQIVRSFLVHLKLPEENLEQTLTYIKEGTMGELFANVEPIDVYYQRKIAEAVAEKEEEIAG